MIGNHAVHAPGSGRYALAIFDFDGTLADSAAVMADALDQAAEHFGFRRTTMAEKAALRSLDLRTVLDQLGLPGRKLPGVVRFLRAQAAAQAATIRLFPGAEEMLHTLAGRGVLLAVVSSNAEATVRQVMGPRCTALIHSFECGASVFGKATRFRRVLRRTRRAAADAICIGDETRDVEAATACGLASGAVTWGYAAPAQLRDARPTLVLERMEEIAAHVAGPSQAA